MPDIEIKPAYLITGLSTVELVVTPEELRALVDTGLEVLGLQPVLPDFPSSSRLAIRAAKSMEGGYVEHDGPMTKSATSASPFREELDTECSSCAEGIPLNECPNSKRPCGHHCNHSWDQDECCWCGKVFDEPEADPYVDKAPEPSTPEPDQSPASTQEPDPIPQQYAPMLGLPSHKIKQVVEAFGRYKAQGRKLTDNAIVGRLTPYTNGHSCQQIREILRANGVDIPEPPSPRERAKKAGAANAAKWADKKPSSPVMEPIEPPSDPSEEIDILHPDSDPLPGMWDKSDMVGGRDYSIPEPAPEPRREAARPWDKPYSVNIGLEAIKMLRKGKSLGTIMVLKGIGPSEARRLQALAKDMSESEYTSLAADWRERSKTHVQEAA